MTGTFRVLKGMQKGMTTLENKLAISFKVKHTVIILVTISSLSIWTRQMKLYLQRPVHKTSRYLCFPGVSDENPPAMWGTWVRSLGWEDPLEKGKATHSNILTWRIPWTVYSPRGCRVRHDRATLTPSVTPHSGFWKLSSSVYPQPILLPTGLPAVIAVSWDLYFPSLVRFYSIRT